MVSLSRRYHVTQAIIVSSLFFAFLHFSNSGFSLLAFINLFLFGVFASLLLLEFGNIWIAGAFHSVWNFVQGNIYGIQVSGTNKSSSVFVTSNVAGREIINGGSFGMEGGLSVTFILALGIVLLFYLLYKRGDIIDITQQQEQVVDAMQEIKAAYNSSDSTDNLNADNSNIDNVDAFVDSHTSDNDTSTQKTVFDENYFKD